MTASTAPSPTAAGSGASATQSFRSTEKYRGGDTTASPERVSVVVRDILLAVHEVIRRHSIAAARAMKDEGRPNDLLERLAADPAFPLPPAAMMAVTEPSRTASLVATGYLESQAGSTAVAVRSMR